MDNDNGEGQTRSSKKDERRNMQKVVRHMQERFEKEVSGQSLMRVNGDVVQMVAEDDDARGFQLQTTGEGFPAVWI